MIRKDQNKSGVWIFFHINEDTPFKVTETNEFLGNLEIPTLEISLSFFDKFIQTSIFNQERFSNLFE